MRAALVVIMLGAGVARADDALAELRALEAAARSAALSASVSEVKEGLDVRFDGSVSAKREIMPVIPGDGEVRQARMKSESRQERAPSSPVSKPIPAVSEKAPDSPGKNALGVVGVVLVIGAAVAVGVATGGVLGLVLGALTLLAGRILFRYLF